MKLVEKHIIKCTDKRYKAIDETAYKSKNLYNASLYAVRQHFFETKQYLSYASLQHIFQEDNQFDYRSLPSKVAQWTMKLLDQNFKSFFKSMQEFQKNPSKFKGRPRIPKYLDKEKGRFILTYTNQAISKRDLDTKGLLNVSGLELNISTLLTYNQINQVRIVKRTDCYVIEIIYEVADVLPLEDNGRYAAIDLGVSNLATVTSNIRGFQPFVIDGKRLKSINQYYNKELAKLQSVLSIRQQVHSSKQTRKLTSKRNNKVTDYLHKASRLIVNQLQASNITTLVIGLNKQWKQDTNLGSVVNQNFVQIPHSKFIEILQYKCALVGITVEVINESYTSKCSFLDNEDICKHDTYLGKRIHRGLFKASDGKVINADVNGSYNILLKCKPNAFTSNGVEGVVVHPSIIKIEN